MKINFLNETEVVVTNGYSSSVFNVQELLQFLRESVEDCSSISLTTKGNAALLGLLLGISYMEIPEEDVADLKEAKFQVAFETGRNISTGYMLTPKYKIEVPLTESLFLYFRRLEVKQLLKDLGLYNKEVRRKIENAVTLDQLEIMYYNLIK